MIDPTPTPTPTMNEETDTPETLADIIAEMRRFAAFAAGRSRITPAPSLAAEQEGHAAQLTKYADRIEAAYKREHAQWHGETNAAKEERNRVACRMRYEFAAKCRACKAAPGNAAAMRAALERIVRYEDGIVGCIESGHASGVDWDGITFAMIQTAKEALAAPARNCDRFKTADEAVVAFADHLRAWENAHGIFSDYPDHPVQVPAGAIRWLYAPAKGGAK